MNLRALLPSSLLPLGLAFVLPACGSSSPENFIEKSFEIQCKYVKDCESADWDQLGYDSVKECRDDLLSLDVDGKTLMDEFVESCTDFDRGSARKCLKASRKQAKDCSVGEELSTEDAEACSSVCGELMMESMGLELDPNHERFVGRMLEQLESNGQLDLDEPIEELSTQP